MAPERLYIPCRSNDQDQCPLFPNCYEDKHHLYPRKLGQSAVVGALPPEDQAQVHKFISDPRNHVRSCRAIHSRVLDAMPIALPTIEYIREFNQQRPAA